ncbi:solute carrier family 22 member 13-like [Astyanax mexicanus]|uniref:Solute carrier family 22 member 13-like n=1 Tax=Astyanax mexicanus TaxID=7994 RepID=A0A8T2LGK8_ASTMX|nr:solute carrier family 22 member 13-like [Astyanax mexicanus]
MGSLQRDVYLRLSLPIFFTAFLFFVDVFIETKSCHVDTGDQLLNFTQEDKENYISQRSLEPRSNITHLINESVCIVESSFSYGQATYMTGLLIGSIIGGTLSDKYGKKFLLVCSSVLHSVVALLTAFFPYALFYLSVRCMAGIACCAIHICTYSLGVEWSIPKYRIWPTTLLSFIFSLGMMALAAVAYLTTGWMQFHLALAIPQILCLPLYFSIPESPRWLLLNKRMHVLEDYRNRSPEDRQYLDLLLDSEGNESQKANKEETDCKKVSDFTHFKSPTILLRLFVMSFIGIASALTYYGICFSVGSFGVDIYLAQFFSGLSESPSLLLPLLLARWGRRPFSMVSLLLSGTGCLLSLLVFKFCEIPALVMALALTGKLCVQATTCVSLLYGIELFPTVIRQKCVGLVSLCYRVGCIVNAVVAPKGGVSLGAMICYSSGPILGAGLCLLLPETSGIPLPDTVQDCEKQPTLQLGSFCPPWSSKPKPNQEPAFTEAKDPESQLESNPILPVKFPEC